MPVGRDWDDKYIDVDGVQTHYIEAGSGEPLLLIHGGGETSSAELNFATNMRHLSRQLRVIALDIAGYGYTPGRDPQDFPSAAQGDFVIAFMRRLRLVAHVGGNSHGGWLVQYVAHAAPDLVRRLIIINSGSGTIPTPDSEEGLTYVASSPKNDRPFPTLENIREHLMESYLHQEVVTEQRVQLTYEIALRNHDFNKRRHHFIAPTVATKNADLSYKGKYLSEWAHELRRPVLLTWSKENIRVGPEQVLPFFNRLPDAEMHVFGGAGHSVQTECPERWSAVVSNFLLAER